MKTVDYTLEKSVLLRTFLKAGFYTQLYFSPYCSFYFLIQPTSEKYKRNHTKKIITPKLAGHIISNYFDMFGKIK